MTPEAIKKEIFEALGQASMCWSETPKGVFQSDRAVEIGDALVVKVAEYASLVTKEKDTRIADLEAKLAQAIEFQKRAFSYGANGCSLEEFFTAQEKEAQESEKGGL